MLQKIMNPIIDNSQHGFRPNRSIATAIKEVAENYKTYEYKYEFDLDSCFNRIELEAVDTVLEKYELPKEFINYVR